MLLLSIRLGKCSLNTNMTFNDGYDAERSTFSFSQNSGWMLLSLINYLIQYTVVTSYTSDLISQSFIAANPASSYN